MADRVRGAGASVAFDGASLARSVNGTIVREGRLPIRGGAVDSRRVEPGNAFFALPGDRTDGHRFVVDAAQRGAAALVVTQDVATEGIGDASVIRVGDVAVALQQAAAEWRNRFQPVVVGVTGSLAKTSTKEQIAEVLSERWNVLRNDANENNEIGLPLTMLRLAPEHEAAVLEMGMYTPGDIALLATLARPSIGVVTAVRGTHLSRAGSIDEIERGKRELVEALPAGGTAVLNADDPRVARMLRHLAAGVRVVNYGFGEWADVRATDIRSLGFGGMAFQLSTHQGVIEATIPALGHHSVHNALAAAAVGVAARMDLPTIARGLAREWHAPHRSTVIDLGPIKILDDSYNAAPDSMIAALDLLASLPAKRRIAILGEMLELGETSAAEHLRIGEYAAHKADVVVESGVKSLGYNDGVSAGNGAIWDDHREDTLFDVLMPFEPGDLILIKGSRGSKTEEWISVLEKVAARLKEPVG